MQPPRSLPASALAILLAPTLFSVSVAIASADGPITVRLTPFDPAGDNATASITATGDDATVVVAATGLAPNSGNPIYLHAGTCAKPSASFGNLFRILARSGDPGYTYWRYATDQSSQPPTAP